MKMFIIIREEEREREMQLVEMRFGKSVSLKETWSIFRQTMGTCNERLAERTIYIRRREKETSNNKIPKNEIILVINRNHGDTHADDDPDRDSITSLKMRDKRDCLYISLNQLFTICHHDYQLDFGLLFAIRLLRHHNDHENVFTHHSFVSRFPYDSSAWNKKKRHLK